jgi:hypothetical protein
MFSQCKTALWSRTGYQANRLSYHLTTYFIRYCPELRSYGLTDLQHSLSNGVLLHYISPMRLRQSSNLSAETGLVRKSVACLSVLTYLNSISRLIMRSLTK